MDLFTELVAVINIAVFIIFNRRNRPAASPPPPPPSIVQSMNIDVPSIRPPMGEESIEEIANRLRSRRVTTRTDLPPAPVRNLRRFRSSFQSTSGEAVVNRLFVEQYAAAVENISYSTGQLRAFPIRRRVDFTETLEGYDYEKDIAQLKTFERDFELFREFLNFSRIRGYRLRDDAIAMGPMPSAAWDQLANNKINQMKTSLRMIILKGYREQIVEILSPFRVEDNSSAVRVLDISYGVLYKNVLENSSNPFRSLLWSLSQAARKNLSLNRTVYADKWTTNFTLSRLYLVEMYKMLSALNEVPVDSNVSTLTDLIREMLNRIPEPTTELRLTFSDINRDQSLLNWASKREAFEQSNGELPSGGSGKKAVVVVVGTGGVVTGAVIVKKKWAARKKKKSPDQTKQNQTEQKKSPSKKWFRSGTSKS